MKGYLEYLTGDPVCIVRAGPNAVRYGVGGYDFSAVIDVHDTRAIIKALLSKPPHCEFCETNKKITMEHARFTFDLIERELKARPEWERFK